MLQNVLSNDHPVQHFVTKKFARLRETGGCELYHACTKIGLRLFILFFTKVHKSSVFFETEMHLFLSILDAELSYSNSATIFAHLVAHAL